MRAVENGCSLARAAQSGPLTLTDARGRTIATARTSPHSPVSLRGALPEGDGGSFQSRFGDMFCWLVVGLTAILLLGLALATVIRPRTQ